MEGGQCPCQEGQKGAKNVVGRRCNECEDKQGQIVSGRGCVGEYLLHICYLGCHGVTQCLGEVLCDTRDQSLPYVTCM